MSQQAITCNQTTSGGSKVFLWSLIYSTITEPWAQDSIPSARIVGPRPALQYSIIALREKGDFPNVRRSLIDDLRIKAFFDAKGLEALNNCLVTVGRLLRIINNYFEYLWSSSSPRKAKYVAEVPSTVSDILG